MKLIRPLAQVLLSLLSIATLAFVAGALSRLIASCLMAGWHWMGLPL